MQTIDVGHTKRSQNGKRWFSVSESDFTAGLDTHRHSGGMRRNDDGKVTWQQQFSPRSWSRYPRELRRRSVNFRRLDAAYKRIGRGERISTNDLAKLRMACAREVVNARTISSAFADRYDDFNPNAGYHMARELEYQLQEVLKQEFPVPNAMRLFGVNREVPVGAREYTHKMRFRTGEASIVRGATDEVGNVGLNTVEESAPIRHLAIGAQWNIWDEQADQFAGTGVVRELGVEAREVVDETANRFYWGLPSANNQSHGLYGIIDHPFMPKKDIVTGFSLTTIAANPDTILSELHDLVNFPSEHSKAVFSPDTLVLSERVANRLSQTRFAEGSDTTILAHFLENNRHIKNVESAWELEDAGGDGIDGMFAYRSGGGSDGIQLIMPQGFTSLPIERSGFSARQIWYMSMGGVLIRKPLNHIMGFVDTTA